MAPGEPECGNRRERSAFWHPASGTMSLRILNTCPGDLFPLSAACSPSGSEIREFMDLA
ncbi:hypothetical protein SAMN05216308_101528 [Nitrosospira sp. Nsp13]|nr:hypothetical protein SAMN05216308_101528 [Nitrosospira sp. Nsp13]